VDGGHDPVIAAREPPQHRARLGPVARLAEDRALEEDERVGREHPLAGVPCGAARGLFGGQARCGGAAGFAGPDAFVDAGRRDGEGNAESGEDLCATRGSRGENDYG
jgi:hypothetical protein